MHHWPVIEHVPNFSDTEKKVYEKKLSVEHTSILEMHGLISVLNNLCYKLG